MDSKIELPVLDLKSAKKEKGERAYAIHLIKKAIMICEENINSNLKPDELLSDEFFGEIYKELMKISRDKKWFWKEKSKELNIIDEDKFIYDNFKKNPDKKIINSEYFKLNYIERALIFLEMDFLCERSKFPKIYWRYIRNSFVILLFNIVNGVKNTSINSVAIKLKEDGTIIDCAFSYGAPLTLEMIKTVKGKFDPRNICKEMFFYKPWKGELYSLDNKLIKKAHIYTSLCEELDLKIDGIEETKNSVKEQINYSEKFDDSSLEEEVEKTDKIVTKKREKGYVELLEEGIYFKHLGKYKEAKEKYIEAIYLDNTLPTAYYNLGKVLYILEDYDASAKAYKAAFERGVCDLQKSMEVGFARLDHISLYIHLGHAILDKDNKQGKYSECVRNYEMGVNPYKKTGRKVGRNNLRYDNYNKYDNLCIEAAKKYLRG